MPSRTRGALLVAVTVSSPFTTAPLAGDETAGAEPGRQQVERPVDVHQAVGEAELCGIGAGRRSPGRAGSALRCGRAESSSAAAPETSGAEYDVPSAIS